MDDPQIKLTMMVCGALFLILASPFLLWPSKEILASPFLLWPPKKILASVRHKTTAATEDNVVGRGAEKTAHQVQEPTEWFEALQHFSFWVSNEGAPITILSMAFIIGLLQTMVEIYRYNQGFPWFSSFMENFMATHLIICIPTLAYRTIKAIISTPSFSYWTFRKTSSVMSWIVSCIKLMMRLMDSETIYSSKSFFKF